MPIIISPAQGLLLLIEEKKRAMQPGNEDDAEELESLINLYVLGAQTPEDSQTIIQLLTNHLSPEYEVSYSAQTINADPSRRYFETHLALWSLSDGLKKISLPDLYEHCCRLYEIMPKYLTASDIEIQIQLINVENYESVALRNKIADRNIVENSEKYFDNDDWKKMEVIYNCWINGLINSGNIDLPFDIYGQGFFQLDNRGRKDRPIQEVPLSHNLGLLTSNMPSPLNDITHFPRTNNKEKFSDLRTFVESKAWTNYHFGQLVHPFSNSISGTMLIQIRCIAAICHQREYFHNDPILEKPKLANYFRLFSSLLILNSGGHSWFEFLAPIFLPETKKFFSDRQNVLPNALPSIDPEYLLYDNNLAAIHKALDATIIYNRTLLVNAAARLQIHTPIKLRSTTTTPMLSTSGSSPATTRETTPELSPITLLATLITTTNHQHQQSPVNEAQIAAPKSKHSGFFAQSDESTDHNVTLFMQIIQDTKDPTELMQYLSNFFNDTSIDSKVKHEAHRRLMELQINIHTSANAILQDFSNYNTFCEYLYENPDESEISLLSWRHRNLES